MADFRSAPSHGRWDSQTWSLTLGRIFGIRVRVHFLLPVLAVSLLLMDMRSYGWVNVLKYSVPMQAFLWLSVFWHELGHCFGCRWVGGTADDILMWPLGGLAFCDAPKSPMPQLITTLAGPAVNLAFVVVLFPVVWIMGGSLGALFNPVGHAFDVVGFDRPACLYLAMLFKVNYVLFLFNMLLPMLPFDMGRVVQAVLWLRIGYYPSMVIATNVGIIASILLACLGIYLAGAISSSYFMLFAIAIFGLIQCANARRDLELNAASIENEFGYDFSEGYTSLERDGVIEDRPKVKLSISPVALFRRWRRRRAAAYAERVERELDRLLDKIHAEGMASLSRSERRMLENASTRRRERLD